MDRKWRCERNARGPRGPPGPETALSRPVSRVCGRNRENAAPPGRGEDGGRKRCRKKQKADALVSGDSFFTFISSLRQPIECFFNWYNRLTSIQTAPMVRSLPGLLSHVFGRVAAALISLIWTVTAARLRRVGRSSVSIKDATPLMKCPKHLDKFTNCHSYPPTRFDDF